MKNLSLLEILSTVMPLNLVKKDSKQEKENPYHDSEEEQDEFDELFADGDI